MAGRRGGKFVQEAPSLANPFLSDAPLQRCLRRLLPAELFPSVVADLRRFGNRVATEVDALGRECELQPPALEKFDAWGRRVDKLITCAAWQRMKQISAEEGLVAAGHDRAQYGEFSRIYQCAKLYLFTASSGLYSCPLAMTDGAAKVLEGLQVESELVRQARERLLSRDGRRFWTCGQWMTERRGGSDVASATETLASPQPDGTFRLSGDKWFSSATDADVALTLARSLDSNGKPIPTGAGLALYLLRVRDERGELNGIEIVRLKNKLGTRQLPTAELTLNGAVAEKVSPDGRGVAAIAPMLNVTRLYTAIGSISAMRRVLLLARDYATRRTAFGRRLLDWPLHTRTLAHMELETRGCLLLLFDVARLLGLHETRRANADQLLLLRLLTPLLKLYASKKVVPLVSEGLECFGGQGYIEDTPLPCILRDAQVNAIWEGTTNVLSMDVLRVLAKDGERVVGVFAAAVSSKLSPAASEPTLQAASRAVRLAVESIGAFLLKCPPEALPTAARDLAFSMSSTFIASLLIEQATWAEAVAADAEAAVRWCSDRDLFSLKELEFYDSSSVGVDKALVMENFTTAKL